MTKNSIIVVIVIFFLLFPTKVFSACPIELDLFHLHNYSYKINKFDIAMEILEHFMPHITLNNVVVGVFDVGFYRSPQIRGEFIRGDEWSCNMPVPSDADLSNMDEDQRKLHRNCLHGVYVTSIISGIDGDNPNSISGYLALLQRGSSPAARVLYTYRTVDEDEGTRVDGILIYANYRSFRRNIRTIRSLIDRGANIINISMTHYFSPTSTGERARDRERSLELWVEFVAENPNVLFVLAAGNRDREILPEELPQASWSANNVIIVGGSQINSHGEVVRWERSCFGSQIDVWAPAHQIPVAINNTYTLQNGTSFSAPMVTSLAAIIKSLRPNMTGAQIKQHIIQTADTTSESASPHIDFAKAIMEILRTLPDLPTRHRDLFNPSKSDMDIYASDILCRICGRSEITSPQPSILEQGSFPLASIGIHPREGLRALTSHSTSKTWDSQSFSRVGPGYNLEYQMNRPNEDISLHGTTNFVTYSTSSTHLPGPRPSILYRSLSGRLQITNCRYYKENGRSFNMITRQFADYRRLLFHDGSIHARIFSCQLSNPGHVGMVSPYGFSLEEQPCRDIPSETGGPGIPLTEMLDISFEDIHYFVFDDTTWSLTKDLCTYFFDL